MLCSQCGKEVEDDSKFCRNCGSPVKSGFEKEKTISNSKSILNSEAHQKQPVIQPSVRKSYRWKWMTAIVVVCIIMALFFTYRTHQQYPARQNPAEAPAPSKSTVKMIARDGRFIAFDNGTVLDTSTNLMWAAKDNGRNINWAKAKSYCENYRSGGHSDWRMPTQHELAGLYDRNKESRNGNHVSDLIEITACCPWTSETHGSDAAIFVLNSGIWHWLSKSIDSGCRALPVRSGK